MLLPRAKEVSRYAVVGKSGTGKSNAAKAWLATELEAGRRVVCFDPQDEYSQAGRASKHVRLGPLAQRVTPAELERDPRTWLDGEALSLAVVPSEDADAAAEDFASLVELCMATGELLLVADELGFFAFENDAAHVAKRALNHVASRGRHSGIACCWVAQRAVHVPATARAQLTAVLGFCQTHPADLSSLEELAGKDFAGALPHLRAGESQLWCDPLMGWGKDG